MNETVEMDLDMGLREARKATLLRAEEARAMQNLILDAERDAVVHFSRRLSPTVVAELVLRHVNGMRVESVAEPIE